MQEITREALIAKASELLSAGTVDRVLGWKKGVFDYDITPFVFRSAEELEKDLNSERSKQLYGEALIALFGVILGEENAAKVLNFYEGNDGEMLTDLAPFFTEIMVKIKTAREARKAQFLALAGKG